MQSQEVIEGWRGVCVAVGLGNPLPRGFCAAAITGILAYTLKRPRSAFKADGSARADFFWTPLAVGTAVALLT